MVKNKKIIMEYSKSLTKSLIKNLIKSDKNTIYLQSDLIDLHYKKNNLNLALCCKEVLTKKCINIVISLIMCHFIWIILV